MHDNIDKNNLPVNEFVENEFTQIAEALKELARDMTKMVQMLAPSKPLNNSGDQIATLKDWENSPYGKIFNKYLHYNPHGDCNIEELMAEVDKTDCPELFELCRIEKALVYILACLSTLAGPSVDIADGSYPVVFTRRET